jgi:hypothetical protein
MAENSTAHSSGCLPASSDSCDEKEARALVTRYELDRRYPNINVKYQKMCYTLNIV